MFTKQPYACFENLLNFPTTSLTHTGSTSTEQIDKRADESNMKKVQ